MKSHVVNVQIIIDQYDNSDPVKHIVNIIERVNRLIGDLDGTEPRIFTQNLSSGDIVETNVWAEEDMDLDENSNCLYCGERCFDGEMCDEQQAGGFN